MSRPDPHHTADAAAAAEARRMIDGARGAVLSVLDEEGWPMVSRIALQTDATGKPLALLSGLALHSAALIRDPRAALLIDASAETARGADLTRARLSLQVRAERLPDGAEAEELRALWRQRDPKAAVYLGLPDFRFWRLVPRGGMLNAGFGRAYRLAAVDLARPNGESPAG